MIHFHISEKKGNVYLYHSMDDNLGKWSRRFYSLQFKSSIKYKLDKDNQELQYIIPEWEIEDRYQIIKKVKVTLQFNSKAWNRITQLLE